MDEKYSFADFIAIVEKLRSDQGCPWDRVQTHSSLKRCMIEEAYEVVEGIRIQEETQSYDNLQEELGDVLLQVVMHSQIAAEQQTFTLADVIQGISEKMIRRHPHVFGEADEKTADQVRVSWEEIKQQERSTMTRKASLKEIPRCFPALYQAEKIQKKLAKWEDEKLTPQEPLVAVEQAIDALKQGTGKDSEIFGELLWNVAALARERQVDTEVSLLDYLEKVIEKC